MSHSLFAGKQEEDKLQVAPAFVVLGITIAVIICTYEAVRHYTGAATSGAPPRVAMSESRMLPINTNGEPSEAATIPQFGMLHQTLFDAVSDAKDLKAVTQQKLHGYGWVDEQKTVAHIPIERAMQIVAQQRAGQG